MIHYFTKKNIVIETEYDTGGLKELLDSSIVPLWCGRYARSEDAPSENENKSLVLTP